MTNTTSVPDVTLEQAQSYEEGKRNIFAQMYGGPPDKFPVTNPEIVERLETEKPPSTAKAFSGGLPEHHPTPITPRLLRDHGYRQATTDIWSKGGIHIQFSAVKNTWTLLSNKTVLNTMQEVDDLG